MTAQEERSAPCASVLSPAAGKAVVNRIVGELIRRKLLRADRVEWTPDASDTTGKPTDPLATNGGYVTNPSTPVVTLYQDDREVTAVCVTWRRLERMAEPMARRKVAEMLWACAEISTGRRPAPTGRV